MERWAKAAAVCSTDHKVSGNMMYPGKGRFQPCTPASTGEMMRQQGRQVTGQKSRQEMVAAWEVLKKQQLQGEKK